MLGRSVATAHFIARRPLQVQLLLLRPVRLYTDTVPNNRPATPAFVNVPKPASAPSAVAPVPPVPGSSTLAKAPEGAVSPALEHKNGLDTVSEADKRKLTLKQKIKKELLHYWDGTKLLGKELRISFKLALKMAAGHELSRRENRQLKRTVQDLVRLVPFSVFIIVPFAELLLPVALKLFPNMLPSTYEGAKAKEAKRLKLSDTRKEVGKVLRQTMQETGLPLSTSTKQKEEFTEFFRKIRTSGEKPGRGDIINVCKIFRDDLTLDNLSRPQLVAMCRYLNLNTFGTDNILRYNIRHRMRQIKQDDKVIAYEGVDTLTIPELQTATASRGIRTHGISPARLRDDLNTWLELRLKHGVPSTLLVLSNAFTYGRQDGEADSHYDALETTLSTELEVSNAEGAATNAQRLEVLKEQEELIEEENQEDQETGSTSPKDDRDIDEAEDATKIQQTVQDERSGIGAQDFKDVEKAEIKRQGGKEKKQYLK
ncbi:LETM1 domain-containing protein mdm28, mitochondrial [Neolecta irregularis DAH-3]|uniref:LETM1 domain-containing protein mdm28, mitochondrial n=1 Tax=Neolecta irregularis (strain DAH-3) TaxID=1198029 RepID=A0A1U7LHR3_NEOID|nr:LETM1 domain-containing protein mdm28, mitochondrial [Neolecta irregularis DAH-3]|eukprot:OLL22200.1 LETM1 domain-containing protein mdm28, mitochondrial [Neolecta irregularis DAH-3]